MGGESVTFDLGRLLSPVSRRDFFSSHWERQHLLLERAEPRYYDSLITAADLEEIISDSDARYPAIRLAKGGGYLPPEVYTHKIKHGDESFLGVPDVRRISDEYRRGATVALPAIHRRWKALGLLCDQLQAELDHPAHANVYVTPGNAAGFTAHYDTHEVFVLQIAGKKHWSIYAPVHELPHRSQPFTPQTFTGQAPITETELKSGDLLYLPRGFLHSTRTSESFSAHVTIGISVYTGVDLLKEYVQAAIGDVEQRRALIPGFASREDHRSLLRERLIVALERLRSTTDLDRLIDSFTDRIRATRMPRPAPFQVDANVVTLESVLEAPTPGSYRLIREGENEFLEFMAEKYQLSPPVTEAIRAMLERSRFRGRDLAVPLDNPGRLTLIRHLVDIGFLRNGLSTVTDRLG